MAKMASQADLWYNVRVNIVGLEDAVNTFKLVAHLCRRSTTMDTVSPHDDNDNPREKTHSQIYYSKPENRARILAQKKAYYQANREKILAQKKAHQSKPEVRERRHEYNKAYNENHEIKNRIRAQQKARYDRPEVQDQRRAYHQLPRVKAIYKVHSHNRRALEKKVPGTHTPEQIEEQYKRQKGKCYYCHKKVKWEAAHVDHVIPLTRGGSNDISNLVIACQHCNQRKHNKLPHEWPDGGRLL